MAGKNSKASQKLLILVGVIALVVLILDRNYTVVDWSQVYNFNGERFAKSGRHILSEKSIEEDKSLGDEYYG